MGKILLVAELSKGAIREATYELVSFAKKLGGDVDEPEAVKAQLESILRPPTA